MPAEFVRFGLRWWQSLHRRLAQTDTAAADRTVRAGQNPANPPGEQSSQGAEGSCLIIPQDSGEIKVQLRTDSFLYRP